MTGLARLCLVLADNANQKKSIRNSATVPRNIEAGESLVGCNIGGKKRGTFIDIGEV
jgi:hypothetical protein